MIGETEPFEMTSNVSESDGLTQKWSLADASGYTVVVV